MDVAKLGSMSMASIEANKQLERLVALGYPDVADMSEDAFRALARPLIRALERSDLGADILLVPTRELVTPESLIARTSIDRMAGFTTMPPRDIVSFLPTDGFEPPEGPFYLVIEPHTGTCYTNREPDVARKLIESDERLPLTLEEGLAIATQHPEWLLEKNGFNLLARAVPTARAEHLDEPERPSTRRRLAELAPHLARQCILHRAPRCESHRRARLSAAYFEEVSVRCVAERSRDGIFYGDFRAPCCFW